MRKLLAVCTVALATAAALTFFTVPASASTTGPAARPTNLSHFNVCPGREGACFKAALTFQGVDSFVLSNVRLTDTKCDARSVFAFVYDENGFLGQFENGTGCGTTATWSGQTMSDSQGTSWVQILLYACNPTSCSSLPASVKHYNPY